ncbi:hypothetical protein JCGZ_11977 [Jatropha curcas]|uniref:Uncharacterized protein n=1 Tax=Jatropha curcas TaxID=180498 RepID=A0A067KQN4_JATCU|nr:hypothetical protein JCGZ_11977 [Jatropha curcas]
MVGSPSDHPIFYYRLQHLAQHWRHIFGDEGLDRYFQNMTAASYKWTHLWWSLQHITVSSYMLYVPLCGSTTTVAYYPSHATRQYGFISLSQITPTLEEA